MLNGEDKQIQQLDATPWTQVVRVGSGSGNDLQIIDYTESRNSSQFSLEWKGQTWARISWPMTGYYNACNAAMAAIAAGLFDES